MADQDPPVGPLRRLDPSAPEEPHDLGRLEPIDPEAGETPKATPSPATPPGSPRMRDGLALAIALAGLLSLSSIAAIGGLVAISVNSLDPVPEPAFTTPIESAAGGPTIRVLEVASGPEPARDPAARGSGSGGDAGTGSEPVPAPAVAPPPAPPVAPPAPDGGGKGSAGDGRERADSPRGPRRIGGAWCDAVAGSSCDVVVGGTTSQSQKRSAHEPAGNVFVPTEGVDVYLEDEDAEGSHKGHGHHN